jgi:5'-3' exonuclease
LPTVFKPSYSFRRPDSSIKKSVEVKIQSHDTQFINSSATISSNSQQNDGDYNETKQEPFNSSISKRQEEDNDPNDTVRLWEEGWHERYYKNKFNVDKDHLDEYRMQVVEHYIQGLCWVLQYYYHGVPSWDWYIYSNEII